jgi:hypothetical protein
MPLISARNPDVLDVANIEGNDSHSMLRRSSPVTTIQHVSAEDGVSVMTIHSAFQTSGENTGNQFSSKSSSRSKKQSSSKAPFFKILGSIPNANEIGNMSQDEFSVNSLPIQNSDIESVEQIWLEEQRKVDDILKQSKRYSTQTYSDKGTVHSSLHRNFDERGRGNTLKSVSNVVSLGDRSYVEKSSKTRATARLLPTTAKTPIYKSLEESLSKELSMSEKSEITKEKKTKNSKTIPPEKGKPSRRRSKQLPKDGTESTKSTHVETNSVVSQLSGASRSSTRETSDSTLHKEMFRLSLELANTLAALDVSKSEIMKYKKEVDQLKKTVDKLETENSIFQAKLEGYETAQRFQIESTQNSRVEEPACVTPSSPIERFTRSHERREIFSPDHTYNTSFSDPVHGTRDTSDLLFPDLNESHISCPDLYTSRTHDYHGAIIEEAHEKEVLNKEALETTVDLVDPREEIFTDDPFATLNYSNSDNSENTNDGDESICDSSSIIVGFGEEDTICSKGSQAIEIAQGRLNATSTSNASIISNFAKKLPKFRLNNSIESQSLFNKSVTSAAPFNRDASFLERSSVSRIFKIGEGNSSDLSVSVRSSQSRRRHNFLKFVK